jgi:hypothetical protein
VRERVSPASGKVTPLDDASCILEAGADDADGLALHVAWLGFDFEVLEPPEVTEAVARLASRLGSAAGR